MALLDRPESKETLVAAQVPKDEVAHVPEREKERRLVRLKKAEDILGFARTVAQAAIGTVPFDVQYQPARLSPLRRRVIPVGPVRNGWTLLETVPDDNSKYGWAQGLVLGSKGSLRPTLGKNAEGHVMAADALVEASVLVEECWPPDADRLSESVRHVLTMEILGAIREKIAAVAVPLVQG